MKLKKYFLIISSLFFTLLSCEQNKSALRIKADEKDAVVFLDGERVGNVPLDIMVSKGTYTIEIIKERENVNFHHYYYKESKTIGSNVAMKINANLKNVKINESDAWKIVLNKNNLDTYNEYMEVYNEQKYINKALIKSIDLRKGKEKIGDRYYKTIQIGKQIWMAEDLMYGDITDPGFYNKFDKKNNKMFYASSNRTYDKIIGWHLPSDKEWKTLEKLLGIDENTLNNFGERGSISGILKNKKWNNSTNSSGFTVIKNGYWHWVNDEMIFENCDCTVFLTSTVLNDKLIYRTFSNKNSVSRTNLDFKLCSVRLIKD